MDITSRGDEDACSSMDTAPRVMWPSTEFDNFSRSQTQQGSTLRRPQKRTSIPITADEQARRRATFASFGHEGVTASANAYGHLMQITRHFGNEPSGFFCVDPPIDIEPYYVTYRMGKLRDYSVDPEAGMRLHLESRERDGPWDVDTDIPSMEFVHDRWPCFTTGTPQFELSIQYIVSEKTVYQTYIFKLKGRTRTPPEIPTLTINAEVMLRDLNFIENNQENKRESNDENYSHHAPPRGRCLIRMHKAHPTGRANQDAVALFISPFIGGRAQDLSLVEGFNYRIIPDDQAWGGLLKDGQLKITLAYTLDLIPSERVDYQLSPVSPRDVARAMEKLVENPFEVLSLTADPHLNFVFRRNLEHILSVCSIPIDESSNDGIHPIALTCGDLAGHRVATAASFYAFQFLLLAFKHINAQQRDCACDTKKSSCRDYGCNVRARIWRVCRGHLKWLCENVEKPEGLFSPHYWVSGKTIGDWENNTYLPKKSLADAPFHIIKAGDFFRATGDKEIRDYAADRLSDSIEPWIRDLDKNNRNGEYAFPRSMEEGTPHFRFADHVAIWWAIKSVEALQLESRLVLQVDPDLNDGRKKRNYYSNEVQNNILKRFTTENSISKKRMIAVSRNSSENRFFLHAKDSTIFHAMELGLFNKPGTSEDKKDMWRNKIDVWKNSVDCQVHHEDNQDAPWDNPLRFALSIIMAAYKKRINSRSSEEMYELAKLVLLQSSSPNGLFQGGLDENKEPVIFEDEIMRDSYWHVTFEVPYILWKYGGIGLGRSSVGPEDGKDTTSTEAAPVQRSPSTTVGLSPFRNHATSSAPPELTQVLEKLLGHLNGIAVTSEVSTNREALVMKRSVPFNNVIDQKNIVELSDEWLYNQPDFFTCENKISDDEIRDFCVDNKHTFLGIVMNIAVKQVLDMTRDDRLYSLPSTYDVGTVIDIPRTKRFKKNDDTSMSTPVGLSNWNIRGMITEKRTPANAKKRFFGLFRADYSIAMVCYLSSSEREEISTFFDRHASYDKYFFEETTAVLNKWVTELHLSFYQILLQESVGKVTGIPQAEGVEFPSSGEDTNPKWIGRAVMSFRFDGDFFDRYWTCHFLEYNPRQITNDQDIAMILDNLFQTTKQHSDNTTKKKPWRQRRVLELLLFDRILQEMLTCTNEILEEAKTRVLRHPEYIDRSGTSRPIATPTDSRASALLDALNLFSEVNNDVFLSTSRQWQQFQQILQVVEEDLGENLAKIKLWLDRENEREPDRPRWTRNDERRYRSTISKLLVLNNHKIQELQRYHANISSFNASLTRRLEVMRSDLELRGADDIRLFTYVTVVFLPVGFATGIFSMSEAPGWQTLVSMVVTAVVALLVTLIALVNAKLLSGGLVVPTIRGTGRVFHFIVDPVYLLMISPCVYFLARHLYFPVRGARPQSNKPGSQHVLNSPSHIERIHPVDTARKDYDAARKMHKEETKQEPVQTAEEKFDNKAENNDGQRLRRWFKRLGGEKQHRSSDSEVGDAQFPPIMPQRRGTFT